MTQRTFILLGFILLKFLLHYLLISPDYDLQRDEYLHLDQANHLDWGYQSLPPLTSWIAVLIKSLGNSFFWIKFFPALFGALTILIVWKAIEELGGNLYALVLGATCVLFSALLRINILFQPNSFDVLSWTIFYFIIIKYIKTENSIWMFVGAVFLSIGILNKYNIIFLLIGVLPALLFSKYRKVFFQPKFYLAILLCLLIILPNLLWQYNNNFPVIRHLKELSDTQLINVNKLDFLRSQLFFYMGACFVIFSALYALLFYKPFTNYRFFFLTIIFTLTAFIYFKAKDYYAMGIYPIYISFGSVYLSNVLKAGWKRYIKPVLILIPVLVFIPFSQIGFPNKTPEYIVQHPKLYKDFGLLRWEDGKDHLLPQDFADMVGWEELAIKVDSVCSLLSDPDHTLILCDNYGQAGAINYYTTNNKIVASSFDADYINWLKFDKKIIDVVLVKEKDDQDKERKKEMALFDTVYLAGQRINQYAREDTISIYVLRGANVNISTRLKDEAGRKRK